MEPNIVLIVADTARASNFSLYGYDQKTSPNLESIANESSWYTNTIATAPWTMPSHASIFTGLYSSHHGSTRSSPELSDNVDTLHQILSDNGYKNWLITANPSISSTTNGEFEEYLTQRKIPTGTDYTKIKSTFQTSGFGFKTFRSIFNLLRDDGEVSDIANLADEYISNRLQKLTNNPRRFNRKGSDNNLELFSELCDDSNKPFFAYVNIMEPHLKYMPPKESRHKFMPSDTTDRELWEVNQDHRLYNYTQAVDMTDKDFELLESLYNGAIHYTDKLVGKMFDHLKQTGQLHNTLFIIIGDHGENIGENGQMGHSLSLNDALLRVPMVISYPGESSSKKLNQLVQLHDLFPTILREVGLENQYDKIGQDAISLPKNRTDEGRKFAVAEYLGSPFSGIKNIIEKYPDVDYSQYNYEIKTIYSNKSEKLTIYSDGRSRFEKVNIDGETEFEDSDIIDRKSNLHNELFTRVNEFGGTSAANKFDNLSESVENKLEDLGYI